VCRLFGMTTGGPRVRASFWLLDAPGSLREQSRRMPDGTGLGWFSLGDEPVRDRAPLAAYQNTDFTLQARNVVSHTFVAHVRYSSRGGPTVHNAHPFDAPARRLRRGTQSRLAPRARAAGHRPDGRRTPRNRGRLGLPRTRPCRRERAHGR
jgi:hypothetical protein